MNSLKNQIRIITLVTAGSLALSLAAQDNGSPKSENKSAAPDGAQAMAMMEQLAKPGENHKILDGLTGDWTYKVKFWMSPDPQTPPFEYSGKAVAKALMGGRYFQSDFAGKMQMPGPDGKLNDIDFKGMEIDGYDNVKKKFVSSWIDNMGTGIIPAEGTYDPATKTITYFGEYEQMPGMKIKMRQLLKFTDPDHHTVEVYEDRGGGEMKTMEIVSTRKS